MSVTQGQPALHKLSNSNDIHFQPTGKGSALVAMDKCTYLNGMHALLAGTSTYKRLTKSDMNQLIKQVYNVLYDLLMEGFMDRTLFEFFLVEHPVIPVMHRLPKIHKSFHNPSL